MDHRCTDNTLRITRGIARDATQRWPFALSALQVELLAGSASKVATNAIAVPECMTGPDGQPGIIMVEPLVGR